MDPRVRHAHAAFDVFASALVRKARREGRSVPCRRGCAACCHDVAWITAPEARELGERVASMPRARRARVLEGVARWFEGMARAGLPPAEPFPNVSAYALARLACPLLDVERRECMAYDVRPLSCRGHYVLADDASPCASRDVEPSIVTLIVEDEINASALSMVAGEPGLAMPYRQRRELWPRLLVVGLAEALERLGLWTAAARQAEEGSAKP